MYYEINIGKKIENRHSSFKHEHYFATAERSIGTMEKLKEVYKDLKAAFPEPQFIITVTYWEHKGKGIDPETLK